MEQQQRDGDGGAAEADIERLPADLLAHVLSLLPTFRDLSMYGKAHSLPLSHGFRSASWLMRHVDRDAICSCSAFTCGR
jgi:hypothetical protein